MFYPIISGKTRISPEPLLGDSVLQDAISRISSLARLFSALSDRCPVTMEELEINPLQITAGGELIPLDAMMRISGWKASTEPAPQAKIDKLLRPESVLIIGASADRMNMGRVILKNVLAEGAIPPGNIFLLHREAGRIDGCNAFASIADLPDKIDMTVFTIPASTASTALLEELILGEKTDSIILISGGFGEIESGREFDRRLREAIGKARMLSGGGTVVNGPNCMGIVSKPGGYNTFFLPEYKMPRGGSFARSSAVISQSGAWLVTLLNSQAAFLDPKYMITVGNQIDLTITDHLETLAKDPELDIFCIYLEGFKEFEGGRFLRVAGDIIASGGRIILYKAGRTTEGTAAVASHTAAMAGDYEVMEKLLSGAGIFVADSLEEMEDAMKVLTLLSGRKARGIRVGISSDAGYECAVAADRLGLMELAQFTEETRSRLSGLLPEGIIDVHNPVDATPAITTELYGKCIEAIIEDSGTDCLIVSNVASTVYQENLPAGPGHDEDITRDSSHPNTMIRLFRSTDKPMVINMNEGSIYDPSVEMMEKAGLPVFRKIDRAVRAMEIFLEINL
jgi:acyl-CoA synthetase (NDP forming)